MNSPGFRCFICDQTSNASLQPFVSRHAVANHVAGKIKRGKNYQHIAWIRTALPAVDYESLKTNEVGDQIEQWMAMHREERRAWQT